MSTIYVITTGEYSDYRIVRTYTDGEAAQEFVTAYNAVAGPDTSSQYQIEEYPDGVPDAAEMDGLVWEGSWHRMPDYNTDYRWPPNSQRQPGVGPHCERSTVTQRWHTGPIPGKAEVVQYDLMGNNYEYGDIVIRGTSKDHVEKVLRDKITQAHATILGIT